MPNLTRESFVLICTQAISSTREKITIQNQLSGYRKYHREIKENRFFVKNVRVPLARARARGHEYKYKHDLIGHVGLGNCQELAEFLLVEIGQKINRYNANARLRLVKSERYDHVYLEIKIRLRGERGYSLWEVDAWHPRIIDISPRPDGSIKNREFLHYGYSVKIRSSVYADEINYAERCSFFSGLARPEEGEPLGGATPKDEMLEKHPLLYDDYRIDDSIQEGLFDPQGNVHYLQKQSSWQINPG